MFKSLLELTGDVIKIAAAPIEIVTDTVRVITKPISDVSQEIVKEVKEELTS